MHQLHVPTKQLLSDWKKIRFSNKQNLNSQHDRASFPKSRFAWRVAKTWKAFAKSDFTPECSHFSAATHHVYFAQVDHLVCAFFGDVRASCEKTIFPFSLFRKRSCTLLSFSVLFFFSLLFRFFQCFIRVTKAGHGISLWEVRWMSSFMEKALLPLCTRETISESWLSSMTHRGLDFFM